MTEATESNSRLSSASTIILLIAAAIAAVSVGVAFWRGSDQSTAQPSPAAKDWRTVGWAYAEAGDAQASASAYRRATEIEPENAENWSSLGEALQVASTSVVPEAATAFQTALKLDPSDARARYFLAVQKDLGGDHKAAVEDWLALLKDTPPGAPWQADLQRTIRQTAAKHKIAVPETALAAAAPAATAAIPGPTAEQLAAASSIPPGEQEKMVRGMVDRLAARLAGNPRDAEGWIRLMRSRSVLKDEAGAKEALRSGLGAFRDDAATQGRLRSAAAELGIPAG